MACVQGVNDRPRMTGSRIVGVFRRRRSLAHFCGLAFGVAVAVAAAPAGAANQPVPFEAMTEGGLFLPGDLPGYVLPATTVSADVEIEVNGLVARTRVTQRFENPTDEWVEGVYVYPLPETSAVDRLQMVIGERVVIGEIEEREAAVRRYEEARDAGQVASLVTQERPNIFTNAVANIAPNDSITVTIEYQQTLDYDQGAIRLRFPMVVLPRYIPGDQILHDDMNTADPAGTGWAEPTDQVPDAARITPPVADPAVGPINPVTLSVTLDPGFPLSEVGSDTHDIAMEARDDGTTGISLTGDVWADRDFELVWRPVAGDAPTAAVFTETLDDFDYHLVMLVPPVDPPEPAQAIDREVVFIIDTSGSMGGQSIVQAREALALGLDRLSRHDRFNVIAFNDRAYPLFERARPSTAENLSAARQFVRGLEATGGTEMASALRIALTGAPTAADLRQVVFITDGSVGNEAALFTLIHERLSDSRLFTVGIGSAPNSHFMREAAEIGRGTFTYISTVDQVGERMDDLIRRLESPTLTDIEVTWPVAPGAAVDMYPAIAPDLYLGEPVTAVVRLPAETGGEVAVTGRARGESWQTAAQVDGGRKSAGIAAVWAHARITDLERQGYRRGDPEAFRDEILDVALEHGIVSRYTALVAIDDEVVRPEEESLTTEGVATNMPEGVEMQMADAGDTDGTEAAAYDPKDPLTAIRTMAATGHWSPLALPIGATPAPLHLLIGMASLLAATALLIVARRRRVRASA